MPNEALRKAFVARVNQLRYDFCGDDTEQLSQEMGIPDGTWRNYEAGVVIPDLALLRFLCLTGAAPVWLLHGKGLPYLAQVKPVITSQDARAQPVVKAT